MSSEQNDEECDAIPPNGGNDSSTTAGKKIIHEKTFYSGNCINGNDGIGAAKAIAKWITRAAMVAKRG